MLGTASPPEICDVLRERDDEMKMKLFSSFTMNKADIETSINAWLDQNPGVRMLHVGQSSYYSFWGASPLFVTVWYEPAESVKAGNR